MARNVEVKVRIDSVDAMLPVTQALTDGPPQTTEQHDSFFACPVRG